MPIINLVLQSSNTDKNEKTVGCLLASLIFFNSLISHSHMYTSMPFYSYKDVITSAFFEDGITSICNYALLSCENLVSAFLPSTLEKIDYSAFKGCTSLSFVSLSNNIKSIDDSAFSQCTSLVSVILPEGTETIGENAFSGCTALESVTVPQTVNKVGVEAFSDTPFLKEFDGDMIIFGFALYAYNGGESSVTVPDGITSVTDEAFIFHMNLEKVILPDTLVSISRNAFLGCHAMGSVIIPESVSEIGDHSLGYYCNNGYSGSFEKVSSFSIIGKNGSAAEAYASENSLKFTALDI